MMWDDLDDTIRAGMEQLRVPGCAYAVIEGARVARRGVHGVADVATDAPVGFETRFSLQSISKSLTAWAVMALVEDGVVDLDAPISGSVMRWRLPASDVFDLRLVTPRRLLSHHAGVTTAGFMGIEPGRTGFGLLEALDGRLPPPNAEQRRHWEYWNLKPCEPVSVTAPPGAGWAYSNAGFGLLQLMIEEATGLAFADFVRDRVLRPLGLEAMDFGRVPGPAYAAPHGRDGGRNTDYLMACDAAAGAYATIDDLAAFALAGMPGPDGEPPGRDVLRADSVALMHTPHAAADQSSGVPFEAGLGHVILRGNGPTNVHHSGGTIGWRSIYSIFPDTGDGFCMLMNGEAANDLWVPIVKTWRDRIAGVG